MRRSTQRQPERGAVAVEFALVLIPLVVLIFGVIQYGMFLWAMQAGSSAAGDAVRRLSVGDCQDSTQLTNLVSARLGQATSDADSITATVVFQQSGTGTAVSRSDAVIGDTVDLTVTFDAINMHLPFIPVPDGGTITRHAFGRLEDTASVSGGCQ